MVRSWSRKFSATGLTALYRHFNSNSGDYLLSVSSTPPSGYALQATLGYMQNGNPSSGNNLVAYIRNPIGQVVQGKTQDVTYSYNYDNAHRVTSVTDSRGNKQLSYFYSNAGLLLTMQDSDGNSIFASLRISNHKFQIANDSLHNRVRQFEIWNSESVIARCASADYDPTGRLTGIWAPNNDYTAFAYDDAGRLIEKWFPNGVNTQYSYNRDNTLQKIINRHGAGITISQHDYLYDGVGNRITHSELINGTTTPNKYVYDNLNRLTEVRNNDTNALIESYSFGAVGNRIASQSSAFGGATVYYNHDAANQLIDIRTGSSSGPLVAGFVYDENGNLTKKCESGTVTVSSSNCTGSTVTDLTHDSFNRLTQVAKTSISTESYKYDDQGNRIQKTVGSTITNFLYNGPDVVGQYTSSWGTASAILTHGPGMDDPIVRTTSTTTQYFHQDGLGSVVSVTNQSGTTDGTARYDAWGNKIASTGTIPQYGYTGREPDDTGLVYYRARFYDPSIARFTQRDPIGFNGGMNLYAYAMGNPINFNDPTGLIVRDPDNPIRLAMANTNYTNDAGGIIASQQSMARIVPVPGYSEEGNLSWRGSLDQTIINAVNDFNKEYLLQPGDPGYRTPEFVKAWIMIESGGNKADFLRDPLQMNKDPRDWSERKLDIGVPRNRAEMTPEISITAGLEWLNMKGYQNISGGSVYPYQGDLNALRRYNGSPTEHRDPTTASVPYDYHPGMTHSRWYGPKIIGLEMRMLGYE